MCPLCAMLYLCAVRSTTTRLHAWLPKRLCYAHHWLLTLVAAQACVVRLHCIRERAGMAFSFGLLRLHPKRV